MNREEKRFWELVTKAWEPCGQRIVAQPEEISSQNSIRERVAGFLDDNDDNDEDIE